jgi:hypothetical protein
MVLLCRLVRPFERAMYSVSLCNTTQSGYSVARACGAALRAVSQGPCGPVDLACSVCHWFTFVNALDHGVCILQCGVSLVGGVSCCGSLDGSL